MKFEFLPSPYKIHNPQILIQFFLEYPWIKELFTLLNKSNILYIAGGRPINNWFIYVYFSMGWGRLYVYFFHGGVAQ